MVQREIIHIDEDNCTGCGECIPACPEGALQVIDGKARLVNETFCDGLGACIQDCPEGAITVEHREAEPYEEKAVLEKMVDKGDKVLRAHLDHLQEHGQRQLLAEALDFLRKKGTSLDLSCYRREGQTESSSGGQCPGAAPKSLDKDTKSLGSKEIPSRLQQWPVQLKLVPPQAPFLAGEDLFVVADCVPFAYGNFHEDFLSEGKVVVGCPKLDDPEFYAQKLAEIFTHNDLRSIKTIHMEVPCCFGLNELVERALRDSDSSLQPEEITVSVEGEVLSRKSSQD